MDGALAGQRAVVVGGGSGIGLGSARALARDGARGDHRRPHRAEAGRRRRHARRRRPRRSRTARATRSTARSVRDAVDAASDDERRLQIAVVVPGGGGITPVLLFDDDDFSARSTRTSVRCTCSSSTPGQAMVRAGGGSFVAISSTAAVFSTRYLAVVRRGEGRGRPARARRRQRARRARRPRELGAAGHDPHRGAPQACSSNPR